MQKVLYRCGIGMCPTVLYECGVGMCPKAEEEEGVVTIFHPDNPEKGKVTMTAAEWNSMIKDAKPT